MSHDSGGKPERLATKQPYIITPAITLALMSEAIVEVNTSAGGSQLVGTHEHRIQKRPDLVAQGIVDSVSEMQFNIKVAKLTS